jgi:hypothetical protein
MWEGQEGQMESLGSEREIRRERRKLTVTTIMFVTYSRMDRTARWSALAGRGR